MTAGTQHTDAGRSMSTIAGVDGLEITGATGDGYDEVLTPRAPGLVTLLHRESDDRRVTRESFRRTAVADEHSDLLTLPAS
jgi:hypothetical protein